MAFEESTTRHRKLVLEIEPVLGELFAVDSLATRRRSIEAPAMPPAGLSGLVAGAIQPATEPNQQGRRHIGDDRRNTKSNRACSA